jgi:hypothetical protein
MSDLCRLKSWPLHWHAVSDLCHLNSWLSCWHALSDLCLLNSWPLHWHAMSDMCRLNSWPLHWHAVSDLCLPNCPIKRANYPSLLKILITQPAPTSPLFSAAGHMVPLPFTYKRTVWKYGYPYICSNTLYCWALTTCNRNINYYVITLNLSFTILRNHSALVLFKKMCWYSL